MPTLAPKLPWTHPFAGGYPRLGGQSLPTDPDAIDYLNRVAAADGAGVEVGVAMAVDAFVRGCKADGTWSALKASCIMCGARTISGALVPLAGPAPTPYNFASGDYSRTTGLKGDGATKYLDTNRANNADGQDDNHLAIYATEKGSVGKSYIGVIPPGATNVRRIFLRSTGTMLYYANDALLAESSVWDGTATLHGVTRTASAAGYGRSGGVDYPSTAASATPSSLSQYVFAQNNNGTADSFSSGRLAFYSIGSAIPDLAALDNRVSILVSAIAAAL